jgi:UDP-glucose 4-epimerase
MRKEKHKVLVTGCAGFIGYHLCVGLLEQGNVKVTGVDNLIKQNRDYYFDRLCENESFEFRNIDLCNPILEQMGACDFDYIYHLAAFNGTQEFYNRPWDVFKNSTLPNINVLNYVLESRRQTKVIYASSSEIYAGSVNLGIVKVPTNENVPAVIDDVCNSRWSYAVGKLTGEIALVAAAKQHDIDYTVIRYHNVYGPRMGMNHVIPDYVVRTFSNKFELFGYNNTRSFLYVTDAVADTIALSRHAASNKEIYNIGSEHELTMLDLAHQINDILKVDSKIECSDAPEGSVLRRCPDLTKINTLLGTRHRTSLIDGLSDTINYYRDTTYAI